MEMFQQFFTFINLVPDKSDFFNLWPFENTIVLCVVILGPLAEGSHGLKLYTKERDSGLPNNLE